MNFRKSTIKNKQTYKTQRKALFYSDMHDRQTCCLLCCSIVDPIISSLSVKAVREAVCDFFMNIFSDHTEIIADSEIENSYPHSIDEEYHISSLPNGFKQVDYDKMENSIIITYFKDDDYIFLNNTQKMHILVIMIMNSQHLNHIQMKTDKSI